MPKLSVYVPDQLWNESLELFGTESPPSGLVQAALQQALEQKRPSSWRGVSDEQRSRLIAVRDRMQQEADELFGHGYSLGLTLLEEVLSFAALDGAFREGVVGNDLAESIDALGQHYRMREGAGDAWTLLESQVRGCHPTVEAGITRAWSDTWKAVTGSTRASVTYHFDPNDEPEVVPDGSVSASISSTARWIASRYGGNERGRSES